MIKNAFTSLNKFCYINSSLWKCFKNALITLYFCQQNWQFSICLSLMSSKFRICKRGTSKLPKIHLNLAMDVVLATENRIFRCKPLNQMHQIAPSTLQVASYANETKIHQWGIVDFPTQICKIACPRKL